MVATGLSWEVYPSQDHERTYFQDKRLKNPVAIIVQAASQAKRGGGFPFLPLFGGGRSIISMERKTLLVERNRGKTDIKT